jgi:hypothetical protein
MSGPLYLPGSGLAIPGREAVLEYGDASKIGSDGYIKGAMRINDRLTKVAVARNLVANPSFEAAPIGGGAPTSWSSSGTFASAQVEVDSQGRSAWSVDGSRSVRLTSSGDTTAFLMQTVAVVAGWPYTVWMSKNVNARTGSGNCYVRVGWLDELGDDISAVTVGASTAESTVGIHEHVATIAAPDGATSAEFYVYMNGSGSPGTIDCYVDAVALIDAPVRYFDGDHDGAAWDGARWWSASTIWAAQDKMEVVSVTNIDGLHGDPDGRDSREVNADRDGETVGRLLYAGRTIGLTGEVRAGSIPAVRDKWTRFAAQFGKREQDLLIHTPREVKIKTNLVKNPTFQGLGVSNDWKVSGTAATFSIFTNVSLSGLDSYAAGFATASSVSAPGSMSTYPSHSSTRAEWSGQDVFIAVKVMRWSLSAAISSISLGLQEFDSEDDLDVAIGGLSIPSALKTSVASPAVSQWHWLTKRIPASALKPSTRFVGFDVTTQWSVSSGTVGIWMDDAMLMLLDPTDPTPYCYVGGGLPGYEWQGVRYASRSFGPVASVNMLVDPEFESDATVAEHWLAVAGTGVTVDQAAIFDPRFSGDREDVLGSVYAKLTKDNNTTFRDLTIAPKGDLGDSTLFRVHQNRTYRWSMKVNIRQKPATGTVSAEIIWYDSTGAAISVSSHSTVLTGVNDVEIADAAPAGAVACRPCLRAVTNTPNAVFAANIADPCLVDVTDYAPDWFTGASEYEAHASASLDMRARRLVPRPFLVRSVRKTSDMKEPEQQDGRQYKRSYTMSLRSSDPRIYVLDEHRAQLQMTGTPKFVADQASTIFTLETAGLPVPAGYTYEGHFITHPGTGTTYSWSRELSAHRPIAYRPTGGVGFRAWGTTPAPFTNYGDYGANRPTQDIKTRMYRSFEGHTYTTPRVVMGTAPGSALYARSNDPRAMLVCDIGLGGGITKDNCQLDYSDSTILIKRVNSSTWLELRWNSISYAWAQSNGYGANPQAAHAFELWCSHDASGTLTTTKLATWDYESYDSSSALYPFNFVSDKMWLTSWMIDNVVHWELWSDYPNLILNSRRIEAGSYAIPSGLQPVIGTTVAGHCGWSTRLPRGTGDINWMVGNFTPAYIHYYEQSDATLPPKNVSVPVIGTIDTPAVIELRGGVVDPIVSISTPEYDGEPASVSVARFSGTMLDSDPVFVDISNGRVSDQIGQNRRDLLVSGSRFENLRPGVNTISLQAKSWDTNAPAHLLASWRDAQR